jgi:hypothetical protein
MRSIKTSSRQMTMRLPPRLIAEEQSVVIDNYKLAYRYVKLNGWRFENVIPRDDQVGECFLKLCSVLDQSISSSFDGSKARISTFAWRVFYRHLSGIAARAGRLTAFQMSALEDFDIAAPEVEIYDDVE